ncbi:MAG: potassium-transporting ATPase subunit A [Nitrososphaerota archaeon]|nr:potassium-transporting ATPase subunit A [Nitrososphaerota archaeon]
MLQPIQVLDLIIILAVVLLSAWLLAPYIVRVFKREPTKLDGILNPIEKFIYRITGIDPDRAMGWKEYFFAALLLNVVQMVIAFLILTFQGSLPLNPQGFHGLHWDLAFNTVVSFATNTDLQHYAGEQSLSYFSQMTAIQFLQFTSAATGLCVGLAMVRVLVAHSKDMGNFYVDFVRALTRVFIPICSIAAVVLVYLGTPQSISGYEPVTTIEGASQYILVGPVASLVSIMQIGTNGGGYFAANSAYPLQNPSPLTDLVQIFLMLLIPTTLCFVFGMFIGKKKESLPIIIAAYALFCIDLIIAFIPNPILVGPGIETRFGGFMSTFWTVVTTAVTTGSVNSSLAGMHPLAILAAFMGMLIQATPGGNGVGLMYLLMYVIITIFIVGLMSGRTPEYLGMKITGRDVKLVMIAFLIHPLLIIFPTIVAYASNAVSAIGLTGNSIGFTQILYEFTTAAANNGSDFLGATANTPFFNIATAIVILVGRYGPMACLLAVGGSMIGRQRAQISAATLKTNTISFSVILVVSILLLVVLSFLPFLAVGPILAYFQHQPNFFG